MLRLPRLVAGVFVLVALLACSVFQPSASPTTAPPTATSAPTLAPTEAASETQAPGTTPRPRQTVQARQSATAAALTQSAPATQSASTPPSTTNLSGLQKIQHIIIIMQENRSFDTYFGTYPGANGIPMQGGVPTVCVNDPKTTQCVKPYHNAADVNSGGPHASTSAKTDIDGGKMDGFIMAFRGGQKACKNPDTPGCSLTQTPDVMGWHDAREIPNYWTYAKDFVLQDAMYEPNASWMARCARDPQLLDVRQGLRAAGRHVRAQRLLEPAVAPVPGVGLVGLLPHAQ
jgi:hypothetical protein